VLTYPHINPVLISFGPLAMRWYGIMFLVAFGGGWWLGRRRAARPESSWKPADVDDLAS